MRVLQSNWAPRRRSSCSGYSQRWGTTWRTGRAIPVTPSRGYFRTSSFPRTPRSTIVWKVTTPQCTDIPYRYIYAHVHVSQCKLTTAALSLLSFLYIYILLLMQRERASGLHRSLFRAHCTWQRSPRSLLSRHRDLSPSLGVTFSSSSKLVSLSLTHSLTLSSFFSFCSEPGQGSIVAHVGHRSGTAHLRRRGSAS